MSQYLEIFLRTKNDQFICLEAFSRNTVLYKLIHAPYGKIRPLTEEMLREAINIVEGYIINCKESKKRQKEELKLIASFNNSVEEKIERIYQIYETIDDYKDMLSEYNIALGYLRTFLDMIDFGKYEENTKFYCGVEVGTPTVDDIES